MGFSSVVFVFILLAGTALATLTPLNFRDCGSVMGKVESVKFNGTIKNKEAVLKRGTSLELQINVLSNDDSKTLKAVVHGVIAGVPVKFPLGNPNACQDCNVTCPIHKSKDYVYTPVIYVKPEYPSLRLLVKWEVQDDKEQDLFCIMIAAEIL